MFAEGHGLAPGVVQDTGPLLHTVLGARGDGGVLVAVGVRGGPHAAGAAAAPGAVLCTWTGSNTTRRYNMNTEARNTYPQHGLGLSKDTQDTERQGGTDRRRRARIDNRTWSPDGRVLHVAMGTTLLPVSVSVSVAVPIPFTLTLPFPLAVSLPVAFPLPLAVPLPLPVGRRRRALHLVHVWGTHCAKTKSKSS